MRAAVFVCLLLAGMAFSLESFPMPAAWGQDEAASVEEDRDLQNPAPTKASGTGGVADQPTRHITYKTPYEFYLTALTVILGLAMGAMICALAWRAPVHGEILRSFLLVMIVFSSLFLIVAGYSEKQTAPVFGLLGTILGYMFGRAVGAEAKSEEIAASQQTGPISPPDDA